MANKLKYNIAGVNYILIVELVSNSLQISEVNKRAKKYNCIVQSIKDVSKWYHIRKTFKLKLLIPEHNVLTYNNEGFL